jgi:hypothetical protein
MDLKVVLGALTRTGARITSSYAYPATAIYPYDLLINTNYSYRLYLHINPENKDDWLFGSLWHWIYFGSQDNDDAVFQNFSIRACGVLKDEEPFGFLTNTSGSVLIEAGISNVALTTYGYSVVWADTGYAPTQVNVVSSQQYLLDVYALGDVKPISVRKIRVSLDEFTDFIAALVPNFLVERKHLKMKKLKK